MSVAQTCIIIANNNDLRPAESDFFNVKHGTITVNVADATACVSEHLLDVTPAAPDTPLSQSVTDNFAIVTTR